MISPVLENLDSQPPLSFDYLPVIERVNENCVVWTLKLLSLSHCIIKGCPCQDYLKPFTPESLHTFYLQFGSDRRHENRTSNFKRLTAIRNSLRVIPSARSYHSSLLLLFGQTPECSRCTSNLETTNVLEIFPFQVNFGIVLLRKKLRFIQRSMTNCSFAFPVRLKNLRCWDQLRFRLIILHTILRVHLLLLTKRNYKDIYISHFLIICIS